MTTYAANPSQFFFELHVLIAILVRPRECFKENSHREKLSAGESVVHGVIVIGPHAASGSGDLCWRCTTVARTDHQGDVTRRGQHRDPRYVDREGGGQSAAR